MSVLYYMSMAGPYNDNLVRYQEIMNESVVLLATYPLLVFTNWVSNLQSRVNAGWFLIATILLNIGFNILICLF